MKIPRIKMIRLLEKAIYIVGYALILIIMSVIFNDTIQIDNSYLGIWGLLISLVIYILNKTIKPIIVKLTLPITGLTLGIFYPCINVFILKLVDFIFVNHLTIKGLVIPFFIAILISLMNILMDEMLIKPILKKGK
ncbi:MAG: phage holin family protein [Lactobacillales bacterium]|nr:phage holin family protein [Lactobacillales bacterium]